MKHKHSQTQRTALFSVAEGEGGGGGKDWEFGISRCKLLYIGWIKTRVYYITQATIFNTL